MILPESEGRANSWLMVADRVAEGGRLNIGRDADKDNWGPNGLVVLWEVGCAIFVAVIWGLNNVDPWVAVGTAAAATCASLF